MVQQVSDFFENYGSIGLFIHSFIDAIIFPIPAFFTQLSLSILNPSSALWLATIGFIACLLGTPFGYLIGKLLGDKVLHKILKKKWVDKATESFNRNGNAAVLIGAFTPIPFKVFTILSGVSNFSLWKLLGYAAIGRAVKFYAVGVVFYLFGRASEEFVTTYLSLILGGIGILLFIGYYIKRKMQKKREMEQGDKPLVQKTR